MVKCEALATSVSNKIEYKEDIDGIDEWKHSWPDGELSYRLNNFTEDIDSDGHQQRAITVAFRVWQLRIKNLDFRREYNPDASVDIDISFQPPDKFHSNNTLAHAWFPGQGKISGDVEINDNWDWVTHSKLQSLTHPPIIPIMVHELGHSLGLRHDPEHKDSIMYPSFNLSKKKNRLGPRDVQRIQERYGVRSISQRMLDYFQRRRDLGQDFR